MHLKQFESELEKRINEIKERLSELEEEHGSFLIGIGIKCFLGGDNA